MLVEFGILQLGARSKYGEIVGPGKDKPITFG